MKLIPYEHLALGETPNIAARLEGLARPNTAVISPVAAQLVQRSFVLEELGPHELKGMAESMILYQVVVPRTLDQADDGAIAGGFDALVGRDEEIGLLLRRWEQSQEGLGPVVLLSGEAGIGKSSLVEGLRNHVRQAGFTRIAFRCPPYHTHSAFYPIIAHVQRALDWQPEDTADTRLAKLEHGLAGCSLPLEDAVPVLAALLSFPLSEGRYAALTLSPQQQWQQTQDMLVAWLLEEAAAEGSRGAHRGQDHLSRPGHGLLAASGVARGAALGHAGSRAAPDHWAGVAGDASRHPRVPSRNSPCTCRSVLC